MPLYTVTRYCCTSGCCIDCHARGNHGNPARRERIVQASGLTRPVATKYLEGWSRFDPVLVEDPPADDRPFECPYCGALHAEAHASCCGERGHVVDTRDPAADQFRPVIAR